MSDEIHGRTTESKRALAKKLDAAGWGLFFVWVGITFLASLGWGAGLLGVGIIIIGVQVARKYLDLPVEGFSLVVGAIFACGGIWELVGKAAAPGALVPVLFIIAGVLLLLSALMRRPLDRVAP